MVNENRDRANIVNAAKVRIAHEIARPSVGRMVARLTADSIRIRGARISTVSPLISDSTRAQIAFRLYESAELRFVQKYLRPDLDVVELGSSIGVVGSVALRRLDVARRYIAVEADRELAEIARHNFQINSLGRTWTLDVAAIAYGEQAGLPFAKGAETIEGKLSRAGDTNDENLERLTLSDVLYRHHVDRFALIADIEGAEAGMIIEDKSALSRCDQLIIELHDNDLMSVADLRSALVEQHAFSVIAERGAVLVFER
jgi:FkbM family methyltransferase